MSMIISLLAKNKRVLRTVISILIASLFIFLFKYRSVNDFEPHLGINGLLAYGFEDFIMISGLFCIIQFKNIWANILSKSIVFTLTLFNIFFTSKMGFPITKSLLAQIGDFAFIQTSVNSPGIYRNVLILISSIILFIVLLFVAEFIISKLQKTFFPKVLYSSILILLLTSIYSVKTTKVKANYQKNIFLSLFSQEVSVTKLLSQSIFKNLKREAPPQKAIIYKNNHKKNIVFIIVETLSKIHIKDNIKHTMPFLHSMKKEALVFENHYTSWPFSSKSLYSLICSQLNHPSALIESKVYSMFKCFNWVKQLKDAGYKTIASYSGDFRYDNTGNFLKSQGFDTLLDRKDLDQSFKQTLLSIDDLSMVKKFDQLDLKSQNFLAVFITMNSHHPYWTPNKTSKKPQGAYLDSLSYQDHFIKSVVQSVKDKGLYDDTVFIITGDHGKRESKPSKAFLSESMFKVPLQVFGSKVPSIKYSNYTNHYQIGRSILEYSKGNFLSTPLSKSQDSFIFFDAGENIFSILSENKYITLKNDDIFYSKNNWPGTDSKYCSPSTCKEHFQSFFNHFQTMKGIYEK